MHLLQPGPLGGEASLKSLVGQTVTAVLSDPAVVGLRVKKVPVACYSACFICYYPPPEIPGGFLIDPVIQKANLEVFFKEGLIDEATYKQLSENPAELG